jgi:5'-nucleotidase / UDP-sugar diphosphatase
MPELSRRSFLLGSTAAATAAAWPAASVAAERGRATTISIFHTTDLHGHIRPTKTYDGLSDVGGFARCASCIRGWRKALPDSLTLDVGDLYQGTPASHATKGSLMVDLLGRLGYDAWTLGNHDFDWGPEVLEANLAASKPAVLTGNLRRGERTAGEFDGAWEKIRPWRMHDVGGFKIAVVGLVTPGLPYWLPPALLGGIEPTDPAKALATAVREARGEGADAVVVTGHMGWRFQDDYANPVREILRETDDVDIYLAGHSHQNQPSWMLHDTLCSQASYFGIHCGRVDLTFDTASRKLVQRQAFTILMDDRFEPDPLVMQLAEPALAASDAELARTVCRVAGPITARGRGCPLVVLLCEAFAAALAKQKAPVNGVFHGSFGTGTIPAGELTVADCWKIIPYENTLVVAELTGRQLVDVVREDADVRRSDRTLWPFEISLDPQGRPERFLFAGKPVDPERRFRIAFNSYDAQSGGRRYLKLRRLLESAEAKRKTIPIGTREALIDYCLDQGEIG